MQQHAATDLDVAMAKLAYGVPSKHILQSQGADTDLLKFYCTQNSTTYGAKWAKFEPRVGRPVGSGYTSNVRPTVTYNKHLDNIDNPPMGRIVADNYHTITERSFVPYQNASGSEPLPNSIFQAGSGYVQGKQLHNPPHRQVNSVFVGNKLSSAPPVDVLPRHQPILHKIQRKDVVESENGGYGPDYMTTETGERFKTPSNSFDLNGKTVGNVEHSGFTHNYNVEPLTYHPDHVYTGDRPGFLTPRPTGVSITMTDYLPSIGPNGREPLPRISSKSSHETGFTTGVFTGSRTNPKGDADPARSIAQTTWLGRQHNDPSEADRLNATQVGAKENTGFTSNNSRQVLSGGGDIPDRFVTDYQMRFVDRTPQGVDRQGHVFGGVQVALGDGFTKNTSVHSSGPMINTTDTLRRLEPYVARSIKARDVFYDDHVHDSKLATASMLG